jgi:hypothetical protein
MAGDPVTARTAISAGFAALAALVIAADLMARRRESRWRPLGATLAGVLRTRSGRIVVFAVWLWLGWHFLAR